jgi:hypothetical protein
MDRRLSLMLSVTLGLMWVMWSHAWLSSTAPAQAVAPRELRVCNTVAGYSTTIQSAVDAAQPGDVIKVAAGVYTESKTVSGFPYNLYITKTVHLYGGYTCDDWTTQNYTAHIVTIRPSTSDFSVVAMIGQSTSLTPTLDGFTVSGGGGGNHGGGLRLQDSDAWVRHNVITGNVGFLLGGGIWAQRGAPYIENNRIENNRVTPSGGASGGGIELESTQATVVGNIIANNVVSSSTGYGGGIAIEGGGPVTLDGNTIAANAAANQAGGTMNYGYGGGVSARYAPVTLSNNVIQSNTASSLALGFGGGVYVFNSVAFTLAGNTVMSNTAGSAPGAGPYLLGGGVLIESSRACSLNQVSWATEPIATLSLVAAAG